MKQLEEFFHLYSTLEAFEMHRNLGLINPDSICFIKETKQIYTQNTFFGVASDVYDALAKVVANHSSRINNIEGIAGESVNNGIIDNLKDVANFLDGYRDDEDLKTVLDTLRTVIENKIVELNTEVNRKESALNNSIEAEARAREAADNTLQGNITAEKEAREKAISDESKLRETAVSELQKSITEELNSKVDKSSIGVPEGVTPLNESGLIDAQYLPSYVDDVLEYDSLDEFPQPGERGKIYVALDSNLTYRWTGSIYVEVSKSLDIPVKRGTGIDSIVANNSANVASGDYASASGNQTQATGAASHAEGFNTQAKGARAHAEGRGTIATGDNSHTEGLGTQALHENEHAEGQYNVSNANTLSSIGNGTSNTSRHNAHEVLKDGTVLIADIHAEGSIETKPMLNVQEKFKNIEDNQAEDLAKITEIQGKLNGVDLSNVATKDELSNVLGNTIMTTDNIPDRIIYKTLLDSDPIAFIKEVPNAADWVEELDPDIIAITNHGDSKFTINTIQDYPSITNGTAVVVNTDGGGVLRLSDLPEDLQSKELIKQIQIIDAEDVYYLDLTNFNTVLPVTKWGIYQSQYTPKYKLRLLQNLRHTENITYMNASWGQDGWMGAHCANLGGKESPYAEGLSICPNEVWDLRNLSQNYFAFMFVVPTADSWTNRGTPSMFSALPKEILIDTSTCKSLFMFCANIWSPNYPNLDITGMDPSLSGGGNSSTFNMMKAHSDNEPYFNFVKEKGLEDIEQRWICKGLGWTSKSFCYMGLNNIINWNYDDMIDTLINYSINRKEKGYSTGTFNLYQKSYNKLTLEDLAAISAKGYSVNY